MKKLLAILFILSLTLPVIAKKHQTEEIITPLTQLEKRQFQTRTYKSQDQIAVLKSILNVLQDEGYIVYNVNSLLGFVYAVKDFDTTDPNIDISKEFGFTKSRLNYNGVKVATLETSANVTKYGDDIRVRINFKRKLLNEYGNAQFIDDVSESGFYDSFYEKLDKALSLHKDLNTPKMIPVNEVKQTETNSNEKKVILTPDLLKEINDNIEKIINSDIPLIPEMTKSIETEKEPQSTENVQNVAEDKNNTTENIEQPAEEISKKEAKKAKQTKEKAQETIQSEGNDEKIENVKPSKKDKKQKSKDHEKEKIDN